MTLLPRRIECSPLLPNATSGITQANAAGLFQNLAYLSDATSGVYLDYYVLLEAGTYTITIIHCRNADHGILDLQIDGVSVGTVDCYAAVAAKDVATAFTGITVATTGRHTLRLTSTSKNASSSGYRLQIQYLICRRSDATTATGTLDYTARHIDINPWVAWDATSGATLTRVQDGNSLGGGVATNAAANADDGDSVSFYVALAAGTWSITAIWRQGTDAGIFDVTLGATSVATGWDQYAGSPADDQVTTWSSISVATDGVYELKFTTNGKHASSSDFALRLQWLVCQKTA